MPTEFDWGNIIYVFSLKKLLSNLLVFYFEKMGTLFP